MFQNRRTQKPTQELFQKFEPKLTKKPTSTTKLAELTVLTEDHF